ncbi:hypothetical protein WNB94_13230 [Aquabacterium sp. A3]|uniref:hypothetical protein n=1 Tax=Aquabacterium sp. A3 TaxID=3132829 RepID=UPI00311970DD
MPTDRDLLNPGRSAKPRPWRSVLTWVCMALGLVLVGSLYLNPHLMVDLSTLVISCF